MRPEAVPGTLYQGGYLFRVRDRAQKHHFSDQRRVGDFQRKAQADMSAPLFVPDKGAWPRLLREPVLCSWARMRSAVPIAGLTQRGPFETIHGEKTDSNQVETNGDSRSREARCDSGGRGGQAEGKDPDTQR